MANLSNLQTYLLIATACLGALYVCLSAIATVATQFWPASKAAHYLASAVCDAAKARALLAGVTPALAPAQAARATAQRAARAMLACVCLALVALTPIGCKPATVAAVDAGLTSVQKICAGVQAAGGLGIPAILEICEIDVLLTPAVEGVIADVAAAQVVAARHPLTAKATVRP